MLVRKFEGETLDEALKNVKRELGPEAIILKTITNSGLKGAFKKSRIEITAAISENSYAKKARVDRVLSDDEKEQFYQQKSPAIQRGIESYKPATAPKTPVNSYGNIGLNKVVNTVSKTTSIVKSSLDDFLNFEKEETQDDMMDNLDYNFDAYVEDEMEEAQPTNEDLGFSYDDVLTLRHDLKHQKNQIEVLERKILELTQNLHNNAPTEEKEKEYLGLSSLRMSLKTLDLEEKLIQNILRKAHFELSREELNDEEIVYDFALREIAEIINVEMPIFSDIKNQGKATITVLLSEASTGQASLALKLGAMCEGSVIVKYRPEETLTENNSFARDFFNIEVINAKSLSELLSVLRNVTAQNKTIFLDLKAHNQDKDETKKVIDSIRRGFQNIDVLLNLSAINSELYNRKIISKYKDFSNGVIISFMDQCLSFGSILNIHFNSQELPLKFFGTGPVVPDDIEMATKERLLGGLFQIF